jgi:hypothetical protein
MNKLLQYMMDARNLDHRILPGLQKMQKGGKFKMPVATLTTNPEQSSNLSISTNVKSGTYRPTSKVITQAEIKKQEETARLKEEQDRKEALAAAVKRGRENQSYFLQDNRTAGEIENDRLRAIDAQMEQARSNSPFAQTLGSFTSSGYNPAAGRIAAENIGNMTPMMGATRLASTIKDPKNNPYGIGRDKGWFDNTLGTLGLVGDALDVGVVTAPILKQSGRTIGKAYNKVATGESALPVAWKSPAVGLSQEASDAMFKGIANTTKLTDADRALLLEYQYDSKPFTGRWGTVDQSKKDALNNLIKNNNLNFTNDAILTRKFNPTNKSLGAEFVDGTLNLGDRPSSFSAGVGMPGYGSGAVDRLVVPNRYSKQMGNSLLANEYNKVSDGTFNLLSGDVKNFAAARGITLDDLLNAEREVIGTGLNFKRIGKVKNDIGGYDHVVRPKFQGGGGFNARPTLKQIMQMPDKRYTPSPAVMNTKAGLAAASIMSGPFSFIPGTASAVYDLGTSARYAMDGQWDNAKEDLISAGLNAIPTAGVYAALAGMGKLQKAARARAAIRSAKGAMNAKDIAGSSTIRNNITGLVQEFDKAGKEISSMRPRSAAEVKAYNQNLKSQYRTGATPEGPAELMPFRSPDFAGGGMIVDPMGQWAHPGKNTRIPGDDENNKTNITMKGVNYPVLGIGSNGKSMMMYPEQDYEFGGASYVDEYPMMGKGGEMIRRADGSYSKRGLWDNIRANKGSGKKPTKQMLEQEKKIKSKKYANGGTSNPGFEALPEYVQAKILSNMGYGGMAYPFMQEGGEEGEEAYIPQSIEELMAPTRRGIGNFGIGFNNDKFATNYNYTGSNNFKDGTHALNVSLPTFMKSGSLDLSGTYSPGKSYSANVMGTAPADYIKKGAMMNFSGGFEKDTTPMMKNVAPSYNVGAGFNIPTKAGNFRVNASYRKERGGQTNYPYMEDGGFYDNTSNIRSKTVMQDNTNNNGYTQNLTSATSGVTTYADGRPVEKIDMYGITKDKNDNQRYKEFIRIQNGEEAPQYTMQKSFKPLFSSQYKSVSRPISAGRGERRIADMEAFYAQQNMAEGGEANGGMALGQMSAVADKMSKLRQFVSPDQNLDPWIASKLAVMDHSADAISDYMMYNPEAQGGEQEMEGMPEMRKGGSTFSGNAWYKMGGEPCYECGGMYADGGMYDCDDQEKDPVTGKCAAEVVRGREANAANKAANADMNAWAKQVAAIDKANAKQDAAQYAGQLGFDYDWMQSPVDKAEKKAAMAQYKQFFQQNPKTFVADDTSGFNPEQKYIIASKLKQKASTPMGSKAFQQKFNQDPRFMDLGRLQSDIVPMMGGWDATRNYLFGNKEYGGTHINSTKKANFARNAAGWNKANGGPVAGQEMDVTPEELEMLRQQGYQFEIL